MGAVKKLTDILYFDKNKEERVKYKDCQILMEFLFSRNELFLVEKKGIYFVCLSKDGELFSLWHKKSIENGEETNPSEAVSLFRKKYVENKIDAEKLSLFIDNPLKYAKKYKKK
jgi:hypothetical protein